MPYNPDIHHRRCRDAMHCVSTEHDYSQAGLYFVTICVQNHECLFGEMVEGKMVLNNELPTIRKYCMVKNQTTTVCSRLINVYYFCNSKSVK